MLRFTLVLVLLFTLAFIIQFAAERLELWPGVFLNMLFNDRLQHFSRTDFICNPGPRPGPSARFWQWPERACAADN